MKIGSVKYLVGEGVKNTWVNRLMTIASVGVLVACMVIIGLAILISENVNKAIGNLEQQNVVMAYMKDYNWALYSDEVDTEDASSEESSSETDKKESSKKDESENESSEEDTDADKNGIREEDYIIHNKEEALALIEEIKKIDNVADAVYISSEEGLETVKESMLEGQEEYFTFLDDEYGNPMSCAAKVTMKDMAHFSETVEKIQKLEGIDVIQSQSDLADKIAAIKNGVSVAGVWIIAILMVISLVI